MKLLNAVLTAAILIFSGEMLSAEISDAGEYLKKNTVHRQLDNGINIVLLNRGYSPTLALLISFKVGSVDESYRTAGVAHMLEHMLFKGTEEIGTRDYQKEKIILDKIEAVGEELDRLRLKNPEDIKIRELEQQLINLHEEERKYIINSPYSSIYSKNGGIGFNASTSRDDTSYYIELPASKLELWADLESKRLINPVLREFYPERDAVAEERLMRYETSGTGMLFEQFIETAFLAHPFRHPVIGWKSNIENFSIKDVREFYRSNYTPSRMTITIVGKQNTSDTLTLLEKYFGKLQKKNDPPTTAIKEPEQKGERRFEIFFDANPYILIGWHKPTFPSKEDYAFDIIAGILSDGKSSRLYKSLVVDKGIASEVDAWNGYPGARYDNLFIVAANCIHPHTPEEAEKAVYDEIEKLKKNLDEKELSRIITRMESSFIFGLDSNMGIANLLSYYQTVFGNWAYVTDYLKKIKTISLDDTRKALDKYLTKENRTVGILRNSNNQNK